MSLAIDGDVDCGEMSRLQASSGWSDDEAERDFGGIRSPLEPGREAD
ncbi:MAG: hypothetical protein WKF78_13865 [Candidatus Limnocylindrales bacterium]